MQYQIIQKTDQRGKALEEAVGDAMRDGWLPTGGVSVTPAFNDKGKPSSEKGGYLSIYTQAMVKMN